MLTAIRQNLTQQVSDMRSHILDILAQIDDIALQQNPRILADYAIKIGVWENELLRMQIEARRARRKYALAQAAANRDEEIDNNAIEAQLDAEFAEWEATFDARMSSYTKALERRAGSEALSAKDASELKRLYRAISKRLHPDLYPTGAEPETDLFMLAQRAYELGDLEMLRSIEAATRGYERTDDLEMLDDNELEIELAVTEAQLTLLEERLEQVKTTEPYSLAEKLADADWVCEKAAELKAQIAQSEAVRDEYRKRLNALLGGAK